MSDIRLGDRPESSISAVRNVISSYDRVLALEDISRDAQTLGIEPEEIVRVVPTEPVCESAS